MDKQNLKISPHNLQQIEHASFTPIVRLIKEYNALKGIAVGDVLLRYPRGSDGKVDKIPETISKHCPISTKYEVVYVDDDGIAWLKQICVKGGLAKVLINPLTHCANWHYTTDPRQVEALMLGVKYDPRGDYREFRRNNPEYGKQGSEKE